MYFLMYFVWKRMDPQKIETFNIMIQIYEHPIKTSQSYALFKWTCRFRLFRKPSQPIRPGTTQYWYPQNPANSIKHGKNQEQRIRDDPVLAMTALIAFVLYSCVFYSHLHGNTIYIYTYTVHIPTKFDVAGFVHQDLYSVEWKRSTILAARTLITYFSSC